MPDLAKFRTGFIWAFGVAAAPLCHAQAADPPAGDAVPDAILNAPAQVDVNRLPGNGALTGTTMLGTDFEALRRQHDLAVPIRGSRDPMNLIRFYVDNRAQWRATPDVYLFSSIKGSVLGGYSYASPTLGNVSDRLDTRELYVRWRAAPQMFVDVGRINVNNGVGVSYNPTDFFKEHASVDTLTHDYASWTNDRLGSVMLRIEKVFETGTISALYSPKLADPAAVRQFTSGAGLQLARTNFAQRFLVKVNHDFGEGVSPELLLFHEASRWRFGFNLTANINQASTFFFEWAGGNGLSFANEAFQYGVATGTFGANSTNFAGAGAASFRNKLSTGVNYTTQSKLNVMLSYNYNQAGLSRAEWNRWFAAGRPGAPGAVLASQEYWYMRTYGAQVRELAGRQTVFLRVEQANFLVHDLTFASFVLADVETNSYLINAGLDYKVNDRWRVQVTGEKDLGKKQSEFGSDSTSGEYLVSLKYYL
ncbi:hypothetical protein [Burkholderia metallica]